MLGGDAREALAEGLKLLAGLKLLGRAWRAADCAFDIFAAALLLPLPAPPALAPPAPLPSSPLACPASV